MQIPEYLRQYDFSAFSTNFPSTQHPGVQIDNELDAIKSTLDAIKYNLAFIQRDDTQVANLSIGLDQLKPEIVLGTPTDWVSGEAYTRKDVVWRNDVLYVCNTDHTAGTFATDLAATYWTEYLDYSDPLGQAQSYAQAAADAAGEAANYASSASASASASDASADAAALSATAAAASAAAAAASIAALVLPLDVSQGGTGAATAAAARTNLGATTIGNALFIAANVAAAITALDIAANASTYRTALELGTAATANTGTSGNVLGFLDGSWTQSGALNTFTGAITIYRDNPDTVAATFAIEQEGTGDCSMRWTLTATRSWYAGIDNSDNDSWKLSPVGDSFASAVLDITTAGQATFRTAAATTPGLRSYNSTDNASVQVLRLEGDRATPANNDEIYQSFYMSDSAGNQDEFARITAQVADVTSTSEDGAVLFGVAVNGTLTNKLYLNNTQLSPSTSDALALGAASLMWSDLFLASGAVVNFNNGNVTITHSDGALAISVRPTFAGNTPWDSGNLAGASAAEMETGSATDRYVSPAVAQRHPSAPKCWINFNGTGTVAVRVSYNMDGITDNGTGDYTRTITTDFSSANYATVTSNSPDGGIPVGRIYAVESTAANSAPAAGSYRGATSNAGGGARDCAYVCDNNLGDQ